MHSRRLGLALLLSVIMAACGGTATTKSPPGRKAVTEFPADVTVDGRTMHVACVGPATSKEPTILLEAGGGGDYLSWGPILDRMKSTHRLCGYDRAGLGKSEPPKEAARTVADQVGDLRAVLDAAGIKGPFVFGSHSVGANHAIMFTKAFPKDVVGLLFVDPQSPYVDDRFLKALPARRADEPAKVTEFRDSLETFNNDPSKNPEHLHLTPSFKEAAAALDAAGPLFGDRPVTVLSAGSTPGSQIGLPPHLAKKIDEIWAASHQELAAESTKGSRQRVAGAGHEIQVDKPQAVIDALEAILKAVAGA